MSGPAHTSQQKPAPAGAPSPDHIDHHSGASGPLGEDASQTEADDQSNFAAQIDALLASAHLDESKNSIDAPPAGAVSQSTVAKESTGAGLQGAQAALTSQLPSAASPPVDQQPPTTSKFPQASLDDSLTDDLEALLKQVQDSVDQISGQADTTPDETQLITYRDADLSTSSDELSGKDRNESGSVSEPTTSPTTQTDSCQFASAQTDHLMSTHAEELPSTSATISDLEPISTTEHLAQATTLQSPPLPTPPTPPTPPFPPSLFVGIESAAVPTSTPAASVTSSAPAKAPTNPAPSTPHTGTIEQLDAQLARLTEELSLDSVPQATPDSRTPEVAHAAPSSPAPAIAPVKQSPASAPSPAAALNTSTIANAAAIPSAPPPAAQVPTATENGTQNTRVKSDASAERSAELPTPVAPKPSGPTLKQRLGTLLQGLSPALLKLCAPLAAPVTGQAPIIRTAIAVFSLFTVSSAAFAWYYTLVVRPAKFAQASIAAFDLEHGELPSAPDAHDTAATKEAAGDSGHAEEKAKDEPKAKKQPPKAPTRKPDSKKDAKKPEAKKEAAGGH